jgi:hypothetical protein
MARGRAGGGGGRAQPTGQGRRAALPAKLDADAAVAVGGERLAFGGDHGSGLHARGCGALDGGGHQAGGGGHRLELVAVAALLDVGGKQDLGGLAAQVVGGLVGHAQHHKTVGARGQRIGAVEAVFGQ